MKHKHLKRLPDSCYQGWAIVHWTMAVKNRATGWLNPIFHAWFREVLMHSLSRYKMACVIYCLMPDHCHLLLQGLSEGSNQKNAVSFLRRYLKPNLDATGCQFQRQPFDHVLSDDEKQLEQFQSIVDYIARNPERKQLVPAGSFSDYPFLGSMFPGYPDLSVANSNFWKIYSNIISEIRANEVKK